MTFLCNSKLDVAGCKIWAQQYEECYQTSHKDQANFCEATLLSAGIILLPHTTVLCLSPTINSVKYAGVWLQSSVTTEKGISTISLYHPVEPGVPPSLYAFLSASLNASHLLAVVLSQPSSVQISEKAVQ